MGKVKETSAPAKAATTAKPTGSSDFKNQFSAFIANLFSAAVYKPLQGRRARLWTAVGLGATVLLGLYELAQTLDGASLSTPTIYLVPTVVGLALGWLIFRLLHFPPFVEFLIATEAEMNKVSWTSRDDLKRATTVVLCTVAFMALFLFGVDWLWSSLLQLIGVLKFHDTSGLGSTA